jgi:hypothetical protein
MNTMVRDAQREFEQVMAQEAADRQARTVVVAAADLVRDFGKDPVSADRKYAGKYLEISGVVEKSGQGRDETTFVVLNGEGENPKFKIECFFDSANMRDQARIRSLEKGQSITLRGEYHGQVSNLQVRACVLVHPLPPVRNVRKPAATNRGGPVPRPEPGTGN